MCTPLIGFKKMAPNGKSESSLMVCLCYRVIRHQEIHWETSSTQKDQTLTCNKKACSKGCRWAVVDYEEWDPDVSDLLCTLNPWWNRNESGYLITTLETIVSCLICKCSTLKFSKGYFLVHVGIVSEEELIWNKEIYPETLLIFLMNVSGLLEVNFAYKCVYECCICTYEVLAYCILCIYGYWYMLKFISIWYFVYIEHILYH